MPFRVKAFSLHIAISACALLLVLGTLFLGWYRWPGWYLTGLLRVLALVVVVDLALGPLLTLVIANPRKPRRELTRDIAIIAVVQFAALVYGAFTLWHGRPVYYTFSADRLELVRAADIEPTDAAEARRNNPEFAPYWYMRPRWVWAPLPDDADKANEIVSSAVFGGKDVIDMPRYFKPWDNGLSALRARLTTVGDIKQLSPAEKTLLTKRMSAQGLNPHDKNAILMWGDIRRILVVFDADATHIKAMLRSD